MKITIKQNKAQKIAPTTASQTGSAFPSRSASLFFMAAISD
jgi:hypothetical protein